MKGQSKYRVKNSLRKNSNLRPAAIPGRTVCHLSYSDTVSYLSHIQLRTSHTQVKGKVVKDMLRDQRACYEQSVCRDERKNIKGELVGGEKELSFLVFHSEDCTNLLARSQCPTAQAIVILTIRTDRDFRVTGRDS